jgi:lipopolysaccharide transport system ATP-binding protein
MPVIEVRNLSKVYRIYEKPWDKLREAVGLGGSRMHQEFWALKDVTFEMESGSTLGIIGQNGSGKSTLLQILAGIMRQTKGDCFVAGKVSALLELGSGFNPEFTGRENVFMNGAILGLETREMKERFDDIAHFAEIGAFMDQPVKTYSSGMFVRLAFAVAVNVDPDVLLVDEALAVGDMVFQHRCMNRMNQLRAAGKTILLATHDLTAVTKFCDRALLLDSGCLLEDGKPELVVQKYRALIFERERKYGEFDMEAARDGDFTAPPIPREEMPLVRSIPNIDHRFGNGEASVIGVELMDENENPVRETFVGKRLLVRISVEFHHDVTQPIIGYTLRDRLGVDITACNTSYAEKHLPSAAQGDLVTSDFWVTLPHIAPGSYSISPAVAKGSVSKHDMCDWIDNALIFNVNSGILIYGILKMPTEVHNYTSARSPERKPH